MAALTRTPVVLVHGWAGSTASWSPIEKALREEDWDVIAFALPGSPGHPSRPATVSHATSQLVERLRATGEPAILVGHSMGAQVTLLAHSRFPNLVHSEVVIDPAYGGDPSSRAEIDEWARDIDTRGLPAVSAFFAVATKGLSASAARRVMADLRATDPTVIASYLRSEYVDPDAIGLRPATQKAARGRRKPVLSVHSTIESVHREATLPRTPGSLSEIWEGHGHFAHLEDPERFVSRLIQWRASLAEQLEVTSR